MVTKKNAHVERKPLFQQGPQAVAGTLDPNFVYRFVNDIGSRISNFLAAGYDFVEDPELTVGDSRIFDPSDQGSAKVVTSNDGSKSYLMRIKKEWYDADQVAKAERINAQEAVMTNAASQGLTGSLKINRG